MKKKKQAFIEAFRKAAQEHTRLRSIWDQNKKGGGGMVEEPFPYPIPAGKYTVDGDFGRSEITIQCKKCWTEDLVIVAKKVAPKFKARIGHPLSVSGFGTAYNFFRVYFGK